MFITYEGIEGSGKTTQLAMLAAYLEKVGQKTVCTREPGGSQLGRMLRAMLLDCRQAELAPRAELCLFLADRAQHLAEVIMPAIEDGCVVLCDRFEDSTIAYQGYGRGMDLHQLRQICFPAAGELEPDITFLLDLSVQEGLARAGRRNEQECTVISEGRFDAESLDFHSRVRRGYLGMARDNPQRIAVIDASKSPEDVFAQCLAELKSRCEKFWKNLEEADV